MASGITTFGGGARSSARLSTEVRAVLAGRIQELSEGTHSQRGLAAASGLGIGTIRELWAGQTDPTLSTLLALVDALPIRSVEELLGPVGTQQLLPHQRAARSERRSA